MFTPTESRLMAIKPKGVPGSDVYTEFIDEIRSLIKSNNLEHEAGVIFQVHPYDLSPTSDSLWKQLKPQDKHDAFAQPYLFVLLGKDRKIIVVGRSQAKFNTSKKQNYGDVIHYYHGYQNSSSYVIAKQLARDKGLSAEAREFIAHLPDKINKYVDQAIIIAVHPTKENTLDVLEEKLGTAIIEKYGALNAISHLPGRSNLMKYWE